MQDKYKYKYYKYKLKYANIKNAYKNKLFPYILSGGYNEDTLEEYILEYTPEDTQEDTPEDTQDTLEETVKDTSEKTVKDTSEKTVKDTSEETVKDTSEETVKDTSEKTVKDTSEETVKDTTTNIPTSTPQNNNFLWEKRDFISDKTSDDYNYAIIPKYIKTLSYYINEIEKLYFSSKEKDKTTVEEHSISPNETTLSNSEVLPCTTKQCKEAVSASQKGKYKKDEKVLKKIVNDISNYIIKNDIPINFKFDDINNLQKSLEQFKKKIQLENITQLYKLRYKLFNINKPKSDPQQNVDKEKLSKSIFLPQKEKLTDKKLTKKKYNNTLDDDQIFPSNKTILIEAEGLSHLAKLSQENSPENLKQYMETNTHYILDYVINYYKINNIQDIEKLFTSLLMGYNKNYIFYYMILLRWLTLNNKYLYVLKNYVSVLSYNGLRYYLNANINMDEYIPFIIILINRYINHFKFDKILEIKSHTYFEKYESLPFSSKEIALTDEQGKTNTIKLFSYDSINSSLIYDYNIIKFASQITFDNLIDILYNLFRTKLIYHQ